MTHSGSGESTSSMDGSSASSSSDALMESIYSFEMMKDGTIKITETLYPDTQTGKLKEELEDRMSDCVELSQTTINAIRSLSESEDFKTSEEKSQLKRQIENLHQVLDKTSDMINKLNRKLFTKIELLREMDALAAEDDGGGEVLNVTEPIEIIELSDDEDSGLNAEYEQIKYVHIIERLESCKDPIIKSFMRELSGKKRACEEESQRQAFKNIKL